MGSWLLEYLCLLHSRLSKDTGLASRLLGAEAKWKPHFWTWPQPACNACNSAAAPHGLPHNAIKWIAASAYCVKAGSAFHSDSSMANRPASIASRRFFGR